MTLKDLMPGMSKSIPERKVEVTVRVTNPRTKAVVEFGVPTTLDGPNQQTVDLVVDQLLHVLNKWGYVELPPPDEPESIEDEPPLVNRTADDVVQAVHDALASTDEPPSEVDP